MAPNGGRRADAGWWAVACAMREARGASAGNKADARGADRVGWRSLEPQGMGLCWATKCCLARVHSGKCGGASGILVLGWTNVLSLLRHVRVPSEEGAPAQGLASPTAKLEA